MTGLYLFLRRFMAPLATASLIASCATAPDPAAPVADSVVATRAADGAVAVRAADGLSAATQFQAGSISKWACTVAVLRLVEQDRFTLDDPIASVLTGFEGPADIRVRDLLTNRSGLTDGLMSALEASGRESLLALDLAALDAANRFAAGPATDAPDRVYSYDLVNWILVQAILEHQSRSDIGQLMDDELFGPAAADLSATRMASGVPTLADAPDVAGEVMPIPSWLGCAGGMITTPADLAVLMDWVAQSGLGSSSLAVLTRITTPDEGYALGGRVRIAEDGGRLFWLSGSNGAFKSRAAYDPATRTAFAAMTASDDYDGLEAAREGWFDAR